MVTNLKGKRVIITAGPTWVSIDSVRVISNTASGETGILLADKLNRLGAKVTLLLGPVGKYSLSPKIRLLRFRFFDELKSLLKKELASGKYGFAVHSAAVSDYRPKVLYKGKTPSGLKGLSIKLTPTLKIINIFKKIQPKIFLAGFKFEPEAAEDRLIKEARRLIRETKADLVMANTVKSGRYLGYLVTADRRSEPILSKKGAAEGLIKIFNRDKARKGGSI